MASKLDAFVEDCRAALKSQPGTPGREKVKDLVKDVYKRQGDDESPGDDESIKQTMTTAYPPRPYHGTTLQMCIRDRIMAC